MRPEFFKAFYDEMANNTNIWALSGDLGYGGFTKIMEDFPDRFLNTGASEVTLLTIAVGLSLAGKIPVCYSISPFLVFRPFEVIRNYLHHEGIAVKLVGSGQTEACYQSEGFSHHSADIPAVLTLLPGIRAFRPFEKTQIPQLTKSIIENGRPSIILLPQR